MKEAYIAKFLSTSDNRLQFPDPLQRRQAAETSWRMKRLRVLAKDHYDMGYHVCCSKQDVPVVEAVIAVLLEPISTWWEITITAALDIAIADLRALEDELPTTQVDALVLSDNRHRDEALIVAAFLATLERASRAPLPPSLQRAVARASEELLNAGASSQGLSLDFAKIPLARTGAQADLSTMLSGRITVRIDELTEHAKEFLQSRRARTPALPGDITGAAPGFVSQNLQSWLDRSVALSGARTETWLPATLDQWAYRWFVIGQFHAGDQANREVLRALAVIDARTTPFCRWVNGREISIAGTRNQIARHIRAALAGDIQAMMANWPMLGSDVTQASSPAVFRKGFARVGLPGYHFRCRTLAQWTTR